MPLPSDPAKREAFIKERDERMGSVQKEAVEVMKQQRSKTKKQGFLQQTLLKTDNPIANLVLHITDKYGLTEGMQSFLLWRVQFKSDRDCAEFVGIKPFTLLMWKQGRPGRANFKDAYKEFQQELPVVAAEQMQALMWKSVKRTDEMLDATRVTSRMPDGSTNEEPDWTARGKAVEIVSRWNGKGWNESVNVDANPRWAATMNRFMDIIDKNAQQDVIEGEARVIESPNAED